MADQSKESGRRLRVRQKRRYTEEYADEEELLFGQRAFDVDEKLCQESFALDNLDVETRAKFLRVMTGPELTIGYIQQHGFECPILVKEMRGLGMKMPDQSFNVSKVRECVGSRRVLDVMDVQTQRDFTMSMKEWCQYYEDPERTRLLNVISLEFSHTKLEQLVESPYIVKQVDWVDWVWPKHLKQSQTEGTNSIEDMKYPKVQKYCLMSVKGCYTDFHIDFGGTSVWYHILKGRKVFWLIPPTERNIQLYENWVLSGKQSDIFFGDQVEQCVRINLEAGNTFFIPTGWIHAVFTPDDSLVFGGNFLHSFSIEKQLRVAQVEDVTKVPAKFRYPFYNEVLWYVLARYVYCLMHKNHLKCNEEGVLIVKDPPDPQDTKPLLSPPQPAYKSSVHLTQFELSGLKATIMWLQRLPASKRSLPDLIVSAEALLNDAQILIDDHSKDSHQLAVTGRPVLYWTKKAQSLTAQLRQIKPPSYALKQQLKAKEAEAAKQAPPRAESPPTRPISSNQYTISSGSTLNQDLIPSSFAGLIAQTGVNHYQSFTPVTNAPILSAIGSPPTAPPPQVMSYQQMPGSLPPVPPLISNNGHPGQPQPQQANPYHNNHAYQQTNQYQPQGNQYQPPTTIYQPPNNAYHPPMSSPYPSGVNSYPVTTYQTTNATQTQYTSTPYAQNSHPAVNTQHNPYGQHNPTGDGFIDQKPLSAVPVSESVPSMQHNYTTTGTQSQSTHTYTELVTASQANSELAMRPFPTAVPPSGFHSTEPLNKMVNSSTQSSFPLHQKPLTVSTGSGTTPAKPNSNDSSRRRRTRCKKCDSCLRADCGECHFCKDMKKFGGPGRMKQSCIARQCLAPVLPHTACCMLCGRDGWEKLTDPAISDETASSLMECSQCWEIVHPFCLSEKFPHLSSTDAHLNQDLPNSWECPRCVKTGVKNGIKYPKQKTATSSMASTTSTTVKKEVCTDTEPALKRARLAAEESPPTSDSEEDDNQKSKVSANDDTDSRSSGSSAGPSDSVHSVSTTSTTAHVRSCARFPLLTQGIKQMSSQTNTFSNLLPKTSSQLTATTTTTNATNTKPELKGLAALMSHRKRNETSRDRLFKSLKGLKKSSELSNRFTSSHPKKSKQCSVSSSTSTSTTTTSATNTTSLSIQSLNSSSNSSISSSSQSSNHTQSTFTMAAKTEPNDESTDDEVEDVSHLSSVDDQTNDTKLSANGGHPFPQLSGQSAVQRPIIKPMYVVRPAPLDCDVSSEEETEEESEEDSDEDTNDANDNRQKKIRMKAIQKHLKKFQKKVTDSLAEVRDVMVPVMSRLSHKDLLNCMLVCKRWNGFALEPNLWKRLDLSHKKMTTHALKGVVLRQPRHLDLSWTAISRRQLFWLICRLPQLESLSLVGCSSAAVQALATCNSPRLAFLDLSWTDSLTDDIMQDLLSAPNDWRPGLIETKTRLRFLSELRLCGTNISDKTIRLIAQNLPFVQRLDFSNCNKISDMGIGVLATARAKELRCLRLSACANVSDVSFTHLKKCANIGLLDLRHCPQVSRNACQQLMAHYPPHARLQCS